MKRMIFFPSQYFISHFPSRFFICVIILFTFTLLMPWSFLQNLYGDNSCCHYHMGMLEARCCGAVRPATCSLRAVGRAQSISLFQKPYMLSSGQSEPLLLEVCSICTLESEGPGFEACFHQSLAV